MQWFFRQTMALKIGQGDETWFVIRVCTQSLRYAKADRFDYPRKVAKGSTKIDEMLASNCSCMAGWT